MDRHSLVQSLQEADGGGAGKILKAIKNDLIGHETRKREYIQAGILPALSQLLQISSIEEHASTAIWNEGTYIVTLLAHQGPAYVQPLFESHVVDILVGRLPNTSDPRECLITLRCLNAVADNLPPKEPGMWLQDSYLADALFASPALASVISLISITQHSTQAQQLCDQSISLLCKLCTTEHHKRSLVRGGLLKILARRLASFVVTDGLVVPSLEALDFPSSASSAFPEALPPYAHLSPVLELTNLLVEGSKERAQALLGDPALAQVLPQSRDDLFLAEVKQTAWGGVHIPSSLLRGRGRNPFDSMLPSVPLKEKSNSQSNLNFPPLGVGLPGTRRRSSFHPNQSQVANVSLHQGAKGEIEERLFVPYLLYLVRHSRGRRRILACQLLVSILNLGFVSAARAKSFASLLSPILVAMLETLTVPTDRERYIGQFLCNGLHYTRAAPSVLASLIIDDEDLQTVAVDAKAINKLADGLKHTFETRPGRKAGPWKSEKSSSQTAAPLSVDRILGIGGPSQLMRQDMAYREGTLQALAAIAPVNDAYRKQICDQGVLQHIMLSLEPFQPSEDVSSGKPQEMRGNSASTILAACAAVRALTRSVTALRTKLVDADVAKAIIRLMNTPDPEVRIAATKVLINLAMDFSPMKESVSESAVVKKLCEQAHSANARLRLESIWALKQLVVNAPKKLKQEVVNELGSSWIRMLIKTDPMDIPAGEVIGLVDRDYPPRTSLSGMRGVNASSDDIVMSEDSDGEHSAHYADASSDFESETDFNRHTPEDDQKIQEQLLDLIRNLFCGDNASDLVEYVISEMEHVEFFDIMLARMRPRVQMGATRKDNSSTPAPAGIVKKVLYILVHIAACSQRWRDQLSKETPILKQVASFATHEDSEIRAQCCWLAINLLFEDETSDRNACRRRAVELQKIGYLTNVRKLESQDPDLDVRERARTALHLFSSLLEGR